VSYASHAVTAGDVLRWGHARYQARVRRGLPVPPYVAALEREYNRRRKAVARVRAAVA
jgi:hypothetical protein